MAKHKLTSDQQDQCKQGVETNMGRLLAASQSYDKAIIGLSTAALGYVFTFITYMKVFTCMLVLVYLFLILAIITILTSFIVEQYNAKHIIRYYFWCLTKDKNTPAEDRKQKHKTDYYLMPLSIAAGIFFVLAIILFTIFVASIV